MLNIPRTEDRHFGDETGNKEFRLKEQAVFVSNKRLFIKNDNSVRYFDYANISSMELLVHRQLLTIGVGIILIGGTLCLQQFEAPSWAVRFPLGKLMWGYGDGGSTYIITGIILMLTGFLWKTLSIKFKIANPHNEIVLSGDKNTLGALARLVNERRRLGHTCSR
jgi:hypothetical protein